MENIEEAHWYQNGVLSDKYLNQEIQNNDLTYFVISENNYDLIFNTFTFKDYVDYFNKNIAKNESQGITDKTNLPFVKKIQPQIIPPTIVEKETNTCKCCINKNKLRFNNRAQKHPLMLLQ
jgi:hypothetical protein